MFNKTPIKKDQRKSNKKVPKEKKKKSVFQEQDENSEDFIEKKVKTNENVFEDEDTFFSNFNQDLLGFFL